MVEPTTIPHNNLAIKDFGYEFYGKLPSAHTLKFFTTLIGVLDGVLMSMNAIAIFSMW